MEKERLSNKYALITGASSGIGLAFANYIASLGYNIIGVSNQLEQQQSVCEEIMTQYGVNAIPIYKNLALKESAQELYSEVESMELDVEILINNAGIFDLCEITDCNNEKIELFINLHIVCPTLLAKKFGKKMKSNGKGYIINMSSLSAMTPMPYITMYSSTKSYLNTFSQSLRYELKPFGVHVTTLCPGGVATDLYSLPKNLQTLGVNIGVLTTPNKLVKKAVKGVFKNKKRVIPGFINRIFLMFIPITPDFVVMYIRKKVGEIANKK